MSSSSVCNIKPTSSGILLLISQSFQSIKMYLLGNIKQLKVSWKYQCKLFSYLRLNEKKYFKLNGYEWLYFMRWCKKMVLIIRKWHRSAYTSFIPRHFHKSWHQMWLSDLHIAYMKSRELTFLSATNFNFLGNIWEIINHNAYTEPSSTRKHVKILLLVCNMLYGILITCESDNKPNDIY